MFFAKKQFIVNSFNQNKKNQFKNAFDFIRQFFDLINFNQIDRQFQQTYHVEQNVDENDYIENNSINTFVWHINQFENIFQNFNINILNEFVFHYDFFVFSKSTNTIFDEFEIHYVSFSIMKMFVHVCRFCNVKFYFNNKLHRHLFDCRKKHKNQFFIESMKNFHKHFTNLSIIEFIVKHEKKNRLSISQMTLR